MMIGPAPMMRIEEMSFRLGIHVTRVLDRRPARRKPRPGRLPRIEAEAPSYTGVGPKKSLHWAAGLPRNQGS